MPPKHPLSADEKAILRAWIADGAPTGSAPIDRFRYTTDQRAGYDWWALRPLGNPEPPPVGDQAWPRNPIDRFVLARLEAEGLQPSPPADPRSLVKRLHVDLIGLMPTPEVVDAFAADPSDSSYEAMVDRLLASPRYGERWGRHWLDVARYGESNGFERNDPRTNAWPYRDWVIDALNADMPYDRFARMQLAGDLLDAGPEGAAASGFLVAGVHNTVVGSSERMKLLARQDELEEIAATVGQTFLGLTVHCARCHDHKFDPIPTADYYRLIAALDGVNHGERKLPGPPESSLYAVVAGKPGVMRVHLRGGVTDFGDAVVPGGVRAVPGVDPDFGLAHDAPDDARRRALADWIAHPANPIFRRVLVNRVWHHHFGAGIVDSPNDLGFNGGRPSHPDLLDWLAHRFQREGHRLKPLHRLIVLSATYRQGSAADPLAQAKDAANRLLWRHSPKRVEGEVLRDAILQAAGELDQARGGPGFVDVSITPNNGTTYYEPIDAVGPGLARRSIYRFTPRGGNATLLDAFDCPDPSTATPRRAETTTPLQALSLLNNAFVLRMADHMAERVKREAGDDPRTQARRAWRLALPRDPDPDERQLAESLVGEYGLATLCRALFNSNEFLFVD